MAPQKNSAPAPSSEQAPQQDQEMVDIHDATLEDIDAALASAQEQEAESAPVVSDTEDAPQSESQQTAPAAQPKPTESQQSAPQPNQGAALNAGVATQGASAAKPAPTQEEIQAILAENSRLKQEGNQKELFIQRRNTEFGELRKQLSERRTQIAQLRDQLANGLEDRFAESPVQASNDRDQIKALNDQLEVLDRQEERASRITENQTQFMQHVGTDNVTVDEVAEVLRSDGVPEQFINQFKSNPWEFTNSEALVQMGRRAIDRKQFVQADSDRRTLANYVISLEKQIEDLKKRPGQVMQNVQRHLNSSPVVTSASSSSARRPIDLDPTKMTTAEIDAALKAASMQTH